MAEALANDEDSKKPKAKSRIAGKKSQAKQKDEKEGSKDGSKDSKFTSVLSEEETVDSPSALQIEDPQSSPQTSAEKEPPAEAATGEAVKEPEEPEKPKEPKKSSPKKLSRAELQTLFRQEEERHQDKPKFDKSKFAKPGFRRHRKKLTEKELQELEELADLADDIESHESAALLLIKGGTDRFRSVSCFEWEAVQVALCFMFRCGVKLTMQRISEFLIFLLPEARNRSEEDVQQAEHLTQLHGKVQQAAVVLVESLPEADREVLWFSAEGLTFLMQLQLGDARLFFARPSLQRIMCDLWRGVRPKSYAHNPWRLIQAWTRLLCYSVPNMALLILWAIVPPLENQMQKQVIDAADEGRRAEAAYWEEERKKQTKDKSTGDGDEAWECKIGSKICFNEKTFKHALEERCREKVFEIQSRLPLLLFNYKKYLVILTNLLFAAYLIQEKPDSANVLTVLLLSAGAWLGEVRQLFAFAGGGSGASYSMAFWFMDRVNVMELIAFTCLVWTSVLCLIEPEQTELAQQFKAVGVLFLGISQFMALLRMSSVFGPLISMTMNMIVDLLQWTMLLLPIVACLVAALITLFKARTGVQQDNCLPFGSDYMKGVLLFFEIQIGEDLGETTGCVRDRENHPWFGVLIMNLGLWMVLILMLNMLIAMMAKTFDRIYEDAMVDFQYHFIGNLLQMVSEPAVPPVLRTLGVPWMMLSTALKLPMYCCGSEMALDERPWKMGSTEKSDTKFALRASIQPENDLPTAIKTELLRDRDVRLLSDRVEEFVTDNAADTQVQDAFWRKQVARQLFVMDCKVTKLAEQMELLTSTKLQI